MSLTLKKADFEAKIGEYAGWGRGADFGETAWDARQKAIIKDCIESGLRCFYYPSPLDGVTYAWSFLKPTVSLTLPADAQTVALPAGCGGIEGKVTVTTTSTESWLAAPVVGEGQIRQRYAENPTATGAPQMVALVPLKDMTRSGQEFELYIWPQADQEYTLSFRQQILGNVLSDQFPYAYGGPEHAETILESCLAIFEQRYDDNAGIHTQKYTERLRASMAMDRQKKPELMPHNGDRSDGILWPGRRWMQDPVVTFSGVEYD